MDKRLALIALGIIILLVIVVIVLNRPAASNKPQNMACNMSNFVTGPMPGTVADPAGNVYLYSGGTGIGIPNPTISTGAYSATITGGNFVISSSSGLPTLICMNQFGWSAAGYYLDSTGVFNIIDAGGNVLFATPAVKGSGCYVLGITGTDLAIFDVGSTGSVTGATTLWTTASIIARSTTDGSGIGYYSFTPANKTATQIPIITGIPISRGDSVWSGTGANQIPIASQNYLYWMFMNVPGQTIAGIANSSTAPAGSIVTYPFGTFTNLQTAIYSTGNQYAIIGGIITIQNSCQTSIASNVTSISNYTTAPTPPASTVMVVDDWGNIVLWNNGLIWTSSNYGQSPNGSRCPLVNCYLSRVGSINSVSSNGTSGTPIIDPILCSPNSFTTASNNKGYVLQAINSIFGVWEYSNSDYSDSPILVTKLMGGLSASSFTGYISWGLDQITGSLVVASPSATGFANGLFAMYPISPSNAPTTLALSTMGSLSLTDSTSVVKFYTGQACVGATYGIACTNTNYNFIMGTAESTVVPSCTSLSLESYINDSTWCATNPK
jgi:hypothetical protein